MFITRWRWVAGTSLALPRFRGGKKVPAPLARMNAEDLLATVFPDQVACGENLVGEREIPDHPLVKQTIDDCLNEAMDIKGLETLLTGLLSGDIRVVCCDLTEPSPLAHEVLSARPYAFLDDAPLEERRTQAVMTRRYMAPEAASDLGRLDPDAIARVRAEAWPDPQNTDELHDSLVWLGFLTEDEAAKQAEWLALAGSARAPEAHRALCVREARTLDRRRTVPQFRALFPDATLDPRDRSPSAQQAQSWTREDALVEILRGRWKGRGPSPNSALALPARSSRKRHRCCARRAPERRLRAARPLLDPSGAEEWCERGLLARIHHYTVKRLRAEIEPVSARDFMRFLFAWQRVAPFAHGRPRCARRHLGAARRLRSRSRRVGKRNPARSAERLRVRLAR